MKGSAAYKKVRQRHDLKKKNGTPSFVLIGLFIVPQNTVTESWVLYLDSSIITYREKVFEKQLVLQLVEGLLLL